MEAMALKVPVISTRISGIPELIESGKEGILVEEGDVQGLTRAISKMMDEPELRRSLGGQGFRKVMESFNIEKEVNGLLMKMEEAYRGTTGG
jgi:glycosyltransferase involved in cell wall biosynthesis